MHYLGTEFPHIFKNHFQIQYHYITLRKRFAFSKLLLRYLRYRFHLEFLHSINTKYTFCPNSILFQGLENQF